MLMSGRWRLTDPRPVCCRERRVRAARHSAAGRCRDRRGWQCAGCRRREPRDAGRHRCARWHGRRRRPGARPRGCRRSRRPGSRRGRWCGCSPPPPRLVAVPPPDPAPPALLPPRLAPRSRAPLPRTCCSASVVGLAIAGDPAQIAAIRGIATKRKVITKILRSRWQRGSGRTIVTHSPDGLAIGRDCRQGSGGPGRRRRTR